MHDGQPLAARSADGPVATVEPATDESPRPLAVDSAGTGIPGVMKPTAQLDDAERPARALAGPANTVVAGVLDPAKDLSAQRLDLTKTVDGLKDGSIDALFWSGGLPTPGVTDLLTTARDEVRFLDITPPLADLKKISPVYEQGAIPAAAYGTDADADLPTIVVPNVLLVKEDLDADLACALTSALFDRKAQLEQAHAAAKEITAEAAGRTDPVPLHRGAQALSRITGST